MSRFHQSIDWSYGFVYNDVTNTGGKDTFIQAVALAGSTGTPIGTAGNPLVTAGTGGGSAMSSAEFLANLRSTTAVKSSVGSATSSTTILALNANRKGATIFNDSTAILYLDLSGGTASSTSYSVQIAAGGYYEVPFGWSGLITGIWASVNGNARVTEFS